jgi:hypothetical protein
MRPSARALERRAEDMVAEAKFQDDVLERAGYMDEVLDDQPADVVHHIDGRDPPLRGWPEEIRECWPHCVLNGIAVRRAIHPDWVHGRMNYTKRLFWRLLRDKYGDLVWKGKTYREWFEGEGPWRGLL